MSIYSDYDNTILKWSSTLAPWYGFVYCLAICKRSIPLYFDFVNRESWGDKEAFIECQDLLMLAIGAEPVPVARLQDCLARLELYTPSTEEFSDCTYATDAGLIHICTAELLQAWNPSNVYYIARYCYEIVDASVFAEVMPGGGIVNAEIEQQVERHPFITDEMEWQERVRAELYLLPLVDSHAAMSRISSWVTTPLVRSTARPN